MLVFPRTCQLWLPMVESDQGGGSPLWDGYSSVGRDVREGACATVFFAELPYKLRSCFLPNEVRGFQFLAVMSIKDLSFEPEWFLELVFLRSLLLGSDVRTKLRSLCPSSFR